MSYSLPAKTAGLSSAGVSTNKVIRNTFSLLSMALLFSAIMAGVSMALNVPHPGILVTLLVYFGLLFGISHYRNSSLGLVLVFALTGFMGLTLGPILSSYLALANGGQLANARKILVALQSEELDPQLSGFVKDALDKLGE